jgi:hypothetical protein
VDAALVTIPYAGGAGAETDSAAYVLAIDKVAQATTILGIYA